MSGGVGSRCGEMAASAQSWVSSRVAAVRASPRSIVVALVALGAYQFAHSFKPSDAYVVDIAAEKNVTNDEYFSDVVPVNTYATLPCTVLSGLAFELAGYRLALVMEASALVVATCLFAWARAPDAVAWMQASEAFYAFSFAAGFLVNCAMFVTLPNEYYQVACSINSITMLLALLLSSYIAEALMLVFPEYTDLLYVALASAVVCLTVLIVAFLTKALPKPPPGVELKPSAWAKHIARAFCQHYRHLSVIQWSTFNAVILGVHTMVNRSWKSLISYIADPDSDPNYGAISGTSYTAAVVCLVIMMIIGKRATARNKVVSISVLCILPFITALIFAMLSGCKNVPAAAGFLILYNAIAECSLVVASVMLADSMAETVPRPKQPSINTEEDPLFSSKPEETKLLPSQAHLISYALVFTVNSCISVVMQDAFMLIVGDSCLNLNINMWFVGYVIISSCLGVAGIVTSVIQATQKCKESKKKLELIPEQLY